MEYQILIIGLCVIAWKDAMLRQIPNQIVLIMVLIRAVLLLCTGTGIMNSLEGFFIGGGVMLFGYLLSKGTMGAGDVKLMAVVGSYVGSDRILHVILWSLIASCIFGFIQLLRKKMELRHGIPFAPFVLIGVIFS